MAAMTRALDVGLPDLAELGHYALVGFRAHRLSRADVVWVNERWFLERGVDMLDEAVAGEIRAWLVDSFGYAIPLPSDAATDFGTESEEFLADRYGGGGVAMHGGSGRAGLRGRFQIKGVGPTPLVGRVSEWSYSHGCVWLEEAIREAIYSEVVSAEFPFGSVPVIAILDTGLRYPRRANVDGQRRALLVRPAVVRPAHLERAVGFMAGAESRQEQLADIERTRHAVRLFMAGSSANRCFGSIDLGELVDRVADQIAFGQAHRLFHGGLFSSNLSIDGALHDFGSFRALPNWGAAFASDHIPPFGSELVQLIAIIRSIAFHIKKFARPDLASVDEGELTARAGSRLRASQDRAFAGLWGLDHDDPVGQAVGSLVRSYFDKQQRTPISYESRRGKVLDWLHDDLVGGTWQEGAPTPERELLRSITKLASGREGSRQPCWNTATRLLQPRVTLMREPLQGRIFHRLEASADPDKTTIQELFDEALTHGRRHWPWLADAAVMAQAVQGCSAVLRCADLTTGQQVLWLEGVAHRSGMTLLGNCFSAAEIAGFSPITIQRRVAIRVPIDRFMDDRLSNCVEVAGRKLEIPPMECRYVAPAVGPRVTV